METRTLFFASDGVNLAAGRSRVLDWHPVRSNEACRNPTSADPKLANAMIAIITLLSTLVITMLITKIGAIALKLTGLSLEVAAFQARSAFSGTGFTSTETEMVVNHPVRRRIITWLMIAGNLGIAAVVATSIASFSGTTWDEASGRIALLQRLGVLAVGVVLIVLLSRSKMINALIGTAIEQALLKWTTLDVVDYESLLNLADGFVVDELTIADENWLASRSLAESALKHEGILVLAIRRKTGRYLGSPIGTSTVQPGDTVVVYGRKERMEELRQRPKGVAGDRAHRIAARIQQELQTQVTQQDENSDTKDSKDR